MQEVGEVRHEVTLAAKLLERDLALLTERDLQSLVIDVARLAGWRHFHAFDSRKSPSGFPDLVLVHSKRERVVYAELKSEQGKVTEKQALWIADLICAGQEVYVWRPSSWQEIVRVLTGREAG